MRRHAAICTALGALVLAAPAPAGAAQVGSQVERTAPSRFPENLVGCQPRCVRGRTIPRRWTLLSRTVRLAAGERRAPVGFTCPRGKGVRTVGHLEAGDISFQVAPRSRSYRGRRSVGLVAERSFFPLNQVARGTLYVLCIPR